ncbi:jmjC domain-containing histone demethylation protein 1 [[Candida] anglica]|uniref:JmjC domain-containing histone demethylation protein 1 n=1 Tax=[Candida] anglica TaxID=148631 RepID=A0ABP0EI41_9ASCO
MKRRLSITSQDTCPICIAKPIDENESGGSVTWIQCSKCAQWYHTICLKISNVEAAQYNFYHCKECSIVHGPSVRRRKSARSTASIDYVALNEGNTFAVDKTVHPHINSFHEFASTGDIDQHIEIKTNLDQRHLLQRRIGCDIEDIKPILIPAGSRDDNETLGMKLPTSADKITVSYVAQEVGEETPVEVMDVLTQQGVKPGWNMGQWRDYFNNPQNRDRIRNVISLEISDSETLGGGFKRPLMVENLDLVDKVWTSLKNEPRPKVTKYCLMSVKGSFTDFHIDFGGTSVYYTICSGKKSFLMFPPTDHNLKLYQNWCLETDQNFMWFPSINGDTRIGQPTGGFKVDLNVGDVFIIPSGWIHAVYTPEDSVVIGGNYLTLMDLDMQLKINDIEKATKVPSKFRFPAFNKVLWLTSWYYYKHPQDLIDDLPKEDVTKFKVEENDHETINVKQEDEEIGESRAKKIFHKLISHLRSHLELSKSFKPARASIPMNIIGKDPLKYLDEISKWSEETL